MTKGKIGKNVTVVTQMWLFLALKKGPQNQKYIFFELFCFGDNSWRRQCIFLENLSFSNVFLDTKTIWTVTTNQGKYMSSTTPSLML